MVYVFAALVFFFIFWLMHLVLFRIHVVHFQTYVLVILMLAGAFGYLIGSTKIVASLMQKDLAKMGFFFIPLKWSSLVLYFMLCFWYIAECMILENPSPSMKIIGALASRPEKRLTFEELRVLFSDEEFIVSRLTDLLQHGHIGQDEDFYYLRFRGRLIASLVQKYRSLLKQELGG